MLLADAARGLGAGRLALAAPYMAYARQDRVFLEGEPVSVRAAMRALYASGYDVLVTVEIHKEESLRFFPGRALSVYPFRALAEAAGVRCPGDVIVAPDAGALGRAERLASELGCSYGQLVKERDRVTGEVRLRGVRVEAEGARAVVVDDIISTGGTIAMAARALLSRGARDVVVLAAHYLGLPGAEERLAEAGVSAVYAANTLPAAGSSRLVRLVDVSGLVAGALREA
jgi:ribose-phosphate pyrophosphokinase